MINKAIVKTFLLLISICLICTSLSIPAFAASPKFTLQASKTKITPGESFNITVSLQNVSNVVGLDMSIGYNKEAFVIQSLVCPSEEMDQPVLYNNEKDAQARLLWDTGGVGVSISGDILIIGVRVLETAETGIQVFSPVVNALYDSSANDLFEGNLPVQSISITDKQTAMEANRVISLIDQIGTLDVSTECFNRIVAAKEAFLALSSQQQAMVTNYSDLAKAIYEYQKLYDAYNADLQKKEFEEEQAVFLSNYSALWTLTTETVTVDHRTAVKSALDAYALLSDYSKSYVQKEKNLLRALQAKINEMISAVDIVANFRDDNASVLAFQTDTVIPELRGIIQNTIDMYLMLNESARNMLKEEYAHLQALIAAIDKEEIDNNPTNEEVISAVSAYQQRFARVLAMDEYSVTLDDEEIIAEAIEAFDELENGAKVRLLFQYSQLLSLQNRLVILETQPDAEVTIQNGIDTAPEIQKITETITKNNIVTNTKTKTNFLQYDMSNTIHVLLWLLAISIVLLMLPVIILIAMYRCGYQIKWR